jgi:hypothetical protein
MAGTIVASTLSDGTNSTSTTNCITGSAKAWVNFQGGYSGTTAGVINGSYNVSSITVNGTGNYTANFTTAMPNTNYAPQANGKYGNGEYGFQFGFPTALSTSSINVTARYNNGTYYDATSVFLVIFSS